MKLNFKQLLAHAKKLPILKTAIVHPVTTEAILGAVEATEHGLIQPVLIGPPNKIKNAAKKAKVDISRYELIATPHSHAAAEQAVALARAGKVALLMKGSLHTDELMEAIIDKNIGLRTDRRMSHVFICQTPTYSKLLLLTDCALNIYPDLNTKQDIVQNAIELAHALGITLPKVAILSAVETVTLKLPSTIDAAALCKMSDRGQIQGAILDGPLAFDNAISIKAAKIKNISSPVSGDVDILLVPDLDAGNMLAKQLEYLAKAKLAGIVLGARVPIILTSRADDAEARLISTAIGLIQAYYLQRVK